MKQASLASRALATVLGTVIAVGPAVGLSGQAFADEEMTPEPIAQAQGTPQAQQPVQTQSQSQAQTDESTASNVSPQADETFTVTTDVSPADAGTAKASVTSNIEKDTVVELTATPKLGYKFTGWTVTGGASVEDSKSLAISFNMPAANVTATANFEKVGTINITFDGNGGTTDKNEKSVTKEVTKKTSTEITPASFKRTGYKLVGWSLSKDSNSNNLLKDEIVSLLESHTEKDTTIYAQWAQTHSIKVADDGNGNATADPTEQAKGEKVKLAATPNDGYVFDSWEVVKGDVTIADVTSANSEFTMGDEDVEIKATFAQPTTASSSASTTTSSTSVSSTSRTSEFVPKVSNSHGGQYTSRNADVDFTITQKVPSDATYMLISTDIEPVLDFTVDESGVVVSIDRQQVTSGFDVKIDGRRLTVLADNEDMVRSLRGKTVTVTYGAHVADDADLSPYVSNVTANIPYSSSTTFRGESERTYKSDTEYLKIRVSNSSGSGSTTSTRTATTGTGTTTRTLAKTGDPTSLAAAAAALLTGAGFVVAGRRSKRQ